MERTVNNTFVIAYEETCSNATNHHLNNKKIYFSEKDAEKDKKNDEIVISLSEWAKENHSCGYVEAYG